MAIPAVVIVAGDDDLLLRIPLDKLERTAPLALVFIPSRPTSSTISFATMPVQRGAMAAKKCAAGRLKVNVIVERSGTRSSRSRKMYS